MRIIKSIECRLLHAKYWQKRGKSMKDRALWRGQKIYTYWCPECSVLRTTRGRVLPRGNS